MTELDLDAIEKDCGQTRGGYPVMAAINTLEHVPQLIAEIRRLRADLDAVRALAGPDNESGIISTDALLHTIGTGESILAELEAQIERVREALTTYEVNIKGSTMPDGLALWRYETLTGVELYNQVKEALGE